MVLAKASRGKAVVAEEYSSVVKRHPAEGV